MRIGILILMLFGVFPICSAQPGYMGRKLSIGYYLECFPHANFSGNNSPRKESGFEIEPEHHLNLTWVVNRRWELVADVSRRNREYTIAQYPYQIDRQYPSNHYGSTANVSFNEKFQMVKENYWMFGIRKYFWNQIAPVGLYHQFAFTRGIGRYKFENMRLTGTYKEYQNNQSINTAYSLDVPTKNIVARLSFVSYGIGLKRPISKYLYGSAEVNVQMQISQVTGSSASDQRDNINDLLSHHLRSGIITHNFIDIRLGLGWMF